jgi:hypothetical protein
VVAARLRGLGLAEADRAAPPGPGAVEAVATRLFAAQGQDLPGALWSLGLRARGAGRAEVRAAFTSGSLVRSWPMRGTLHVVAARDLAWILALTGERTIAAGRARRAGLGLDGPALALARAAVEGELAGGRSAPRKQIMAALRAAGVEPGGGRGYHVLFHLALEGVILFGPFDGAVQKIVLSEEWAPQPRRLERAEALREFVARYVSGHGPVSVADIAGYSKLPLGEIRPAIAELGDALTAVRHAGTTLWATPSALAGEPAARARAELLLPGFDEFLLGYSDRSAVLAPERAEAIAPGANGIFRPTMVSRGRVVGTWRASRAAGGVTVALSPFAAVSKRAAAGFAREAGAYAAFLGEPLADVRIAP